MLECRDLAVRYGRIQALHGVSLAIGEGHVVSIVGANGAGKTTLLRATMGLEPIAGGTIRLDGRDLARLPTHEISRLGVAYVPAGGALFPNLTVAQNLRLGTVARGRDGRAQAGDLDAAVALFPVLSQRLDQKVRTLSGGERQMVAIGRALVAQPRVLLLDEPSFGLAPNILDHILDALRDLNRGGLTVVLVEQNASLALDFADLAYILASGRVVAQGPTATLRQQPELESLYFGGEPGE